MRDESWGLRLRVLERPRRALSNAPTLVSWLPPLPLPRDRCRIPLKWPWEWPWSGGAQQGKVGRNTESYEASHPPPRTARGSTWGGVLKDGGGRKHSARVVRWPRRCREAMPALLAEELEEVNNIQRPGMNTRLGSTQTKNFGHYIHFAGNVLLWGKSVIRIENSFLKSKCF